MLQGKSLKLFVLKSLAGTTDSVARSTFIREKWREFASADTEYQGRQNANRNIGFLKSWSNKHHVVINGYRVYVRRTGSRSSLIYRIVLSKTRTDETINSSPYGLVVCMEEVVNMPYGSTSVQPRTVRQNIVRSNPNRVDVSEIVLPSKYDYLLDNVDAVYDFGIEIEFHSKIKGDKVCEKLREAGLPVLDKHTRYGLSSRTEWVLCYDSSVQKLGWNGYELTTPVLIGKDGLKELFAYCEVLNKLDNEGKVCVSKTCGLHTHYGNFGRDRSVAQKIRTNYSMNEKHLDLVMPKSRRSNNNRYCFAISTRGENEKFQKLTLSKFSDFGTFEIRHHAGTINFAKMANWIVFNFKVIRKIVDGYEPKRKSNFLSYWNEFASECGELVEYFISRKVVLNPSADLAVESV